MHYIWVPLAEALLKEPRCLGIFVEISVRIRTLLPEQMNTADRDALIDFIGISVPVVRCTFLVLTSAQHLHLVAPLAEFYGVGKSTFLGACSAGRRKEAGDEQNIQG